MLTLATVHLSFVRLYWFGMLFRTYCSNIFCVPFTIYFSPEIMLRAFDKCYGAQFFSSYIFQFAMNKTWSALPSVIMLPASEPHYNFHNFLVVVVFSTLHRSVFFHCFTFLRCVDFIRQLSLDFLTHWKLYAGYKDPLILLYFQLYRDNYEIFMSIFFIGKSHLNLNWSLIISVSATIAVPQSNSMGADWFIVDFWQKFYVLVWWWRWWRMKIVSRTRFNGFMPI